MASIPLPIPPSAVDATNPPGFRFEDHRWEMLFDDTTDEFCYWTFRMPSNYSSSPQIKVQFKAAAATSGNFGIDCAVMAITPGDSADADTPSFDTDNSGNTATAGTAGFITELTLSLTNNDSMAAGDFVTIRLNRDAAVTGDLTGDVEVVCVDLEYTAA